MMVNKRRSSSGIRVAVIVCAVTVCLLVGLFALCYSLLLRPTKLESKEYILSHMEESIRENTESGSAYVSSFLDDMGIGGYERRQLRRVENYFRLYYPFDMPSAAELAQKTATLFLESFYDTIDREDTDQLTEAVIKCYVASTPDRWAVYRNEEEGESYENDMSGSFVGIGVTVIFPGADSEPPIVESVMKNSPAEEAGISAGDILIAVDGVSYEEIGSRGLTSAIRGEIGTTVDITLKRGEETLTVTATRRQVEDTTVFYEVRGGNLGLITITRFKGNTDEQFTEALLALEEAGVKGIIFDLRNNPGGYLDSVMNALSVLVPNETRLVSFKYKTSREDTVYYATDDYVTESESGTDVAVDHVISVPVVVICNGNTASAGELFTAGIRDYTAMGLIDGSVVGSQTYGKGVMQSEFALGNDATLTMTVSLYNPPSNVNYEGVGVTPDVVFEDTTEDSVDDVLERALGELNRLIATPDGAFGV